VEKSIRVERKTRVSSLRKRIREATDKQTGGGEKRRAAPALTTGGRKREEERRCSSGKLPVGGWRRGDSYLEGG